jgi:general stress protein 26
MAVVSCVSNGSPRSFTCWYQTHEGSLFWKSRTESTHSKAFVENSEASICIYDHAASYPDDKNGVQILGTVRKVTDKQEMENIVKVFSDKFGEKVLEKNKIDDLCDVDTKSTFYAFTPMQIKLVSKKLNIHMDEYQEFTL